MSSLARVLAERLGDDDEAADVDQPLAEPRQRLVGVGVGGRHDLLGADGAVQGLDQEAAAGQAGEAGGGVALVDLGAGALGGVGQAVDELADVQCRR